MLHLICLGHLVTPFSRKPKGDDIGNHNDISDDNGDIGDNENGDKRDLTCSHIRAASWLESGQQESMF